MVQIKFGFDANSNGKNETPDLALNELKKGEVWERGEPAFWITILLET